METKNVIKLLTTILILLYFSPIFSQKSKQKVFIEAKITEIIVLDENYLVKEEDEKFITLDGSPLYKYN